MTIALMLCPAAALAGPTNALRPIPSEVQAVRFDRGQYVVDHAGRRAVVQVRSVDQKGDVAFDVSVLNLDAAPVNIDVGDISADGSRERIHVLTRSELEHRVENRARWAKVWTVLGTSLAAGVQASYRSHYTVTTTTPHGIYQSTISAPCFGCQAAAHDTLVAGAVRMDQIQASLDQARASIGERAVQLTTIMPGQVYGGRVSLTRFRHEDGSDVRLTVTVNGEPFTFAFRFAPEGSPTPAYHAVLTRSQPSWPDATVTPASPVGAVPFARETVPPALSTIASAAPALRPASIRVAPLRTSDREDWHRYYAALLATGVAASQARTMADEQFGPTG